MFFEEENKLKENLEFCKYEDLPEYEINGCHDCKIVRVWDGDTFFAAIPYKNNIYRLCCRLMDVDTPEIPNNHDFSMKDESKKAYLARDKIVEYLTNVNTELLQKETIDTLGHIMPSLTSNELQKLLDTNTLILPNSLSLHGKDKYGRYLVRVRTKNNEDLSNKLIIEGFAKPFMVEK